MPPLVSDPQPPGLSHPYFRVTNWPRPPGATFWRDAELLADDDEERAMCRVLARAEGSRAWLARSIPELNVPSMQAGTNESSGSEREEARAAVAQESANRGATPKAVAKSSSTRAGAAGTLVGASAFMSQASHSHAWSTGCACGLEGESSQLFTFMLFMGAVMIVYLLTFLFLILKKKLIDADPEAGTASKEKTNMRTVKVGASKPSQPQEVPLDFADIPVHWEDRTQEKTVFVLAPEIHICKHHAAGYVF